jgi:hypothetical protein
MKLIIIHGPPAAGKLTVANELARRTHFKVFHNHLSIDCVKPVFDFGTLPFLRLVERIRFDMIAEAARENVDLIHTFVYASGEDDLHYARLIASAEDNGGEVHLVLLVCEDDERRQRIVSESRVQIGKLTDPGAIDTQRERYDLLSPLAGRETLIIDTTNIAPREAAIKIIRHYRLNGPIN